MTKKTQPKKASKLTINKKSVKDLTSRKDRNVKGGAVDRKASTTKYCC